MCGQSYVVGWGPGKENVTYEHIRFELSDGVALITLNRPDQLNAFSGTMGEELGKAYERCDVDDGVRAVVIDKDQAPRWSPAHLQDVGEAEVARYFETAPPGGDLLLPGDPPDQA